jgi:hypothetical protein
LATRRTTFNKRERERSKQAKAAAKRARRQDKTTEDDELDVTEQSSAGGESTETLLKRIEALHEDYDAGRISFEDFDEQKSELVDKLAICLSE